MKTSVILTDVTYMRGNSLCVAGWSARDNRMVRPLQPGGQHWSAEAIRFDGLWPGNVVEIVPSTTKSTRGKPHSYEDTIIDGLPTIVDEVSHTVLGTRLEPSESPSVDALFRQQLRDGRWVEAGADCPSLGAVRVACDTLSFHDDFGKLRCRFSDGAGDSYRFKVSAKVLCDAWEAGGIPAVRELYEGAANVHLRIGLAHPWSNNGEWPEHRAYAMVNGLFPCHG